jgi:hypothetical protein
MRSTAHSSPSYETAAKECCLDDLDPPGSIWLRRMDAANALHMLSQSFSKTHELVTQIKDAKETVVLLRVFTAEQNSITLQANAKQERANFQPVSVLTHFPSHIAFVCIPLI